jgi:hypothetical protein
MARISQGDALTTPIQQPGAKIQGDGYGLLTATVVWKADESASINSVINRGSTCPLVGLGTLTAHKYSIAYDALGIATITVDYVGIESSYHSGQRTDPQITTNQGLTSEPLTTHPNFFELAAGFTGEPIVGVGTGTLAAPVYEQKSENNKVEYEGNNGSRFELQSGGKFLGFKVPEYKTFYGKTSYLAPVSAFSGIFYTTQSSTVQNLLDRVGKTSGDGTFDSIPLIPTYLGTSFQIDGFNQLLLSQVNTEDFGDLYKVHYEVRYNREGYDYNVYAPEA